MKNIPTTLDVDNTLEGESFNMSIDDSALSHIMAVLTDLYSDPMMAVIREYSTNALDAHIEAGIDRPIKVTTPKGDNPLFIIRDYGKGLSIDDIRYIYSRYGTSTKRDSDDVVGMLGLGCKSALTYTPQFMLTSIHNGECIQVSVSRDEHGVGSLTILDQYPTSEDSGVTITIPVSRLDLKIFNEKIKEFFKFWKSGQVLVDGTEPEFVEGLWITDNIVIVNGNYEDANIIVMGGVAYPVDDIKIRQLLGYTGKRLVYYVNIGDVHFTPSREALQMTETTKSTITRLIDEVKKEYRSYFENKINTLPQHEVIEYAGNVKREYSVDKLTWNGKPIPTMVDSNNSILALTRGMKNAVKSKQIALYRALNALWITDFTAAGVTSLKRAKIQKYVEKHNLSYDRLYFSETFNWLDWVDPTRVISWNDIAKVNVDKQERQDRSPIVYLAHTHEGVKNFLIDEIPTDLPLYYYHKDEIIVRSPMINEAHPQGWTLVRLGKNQVNKFLRIHSGAIRLTENNYSKWAKDWIDKLSDLDKHVIGGSIVPRISYSLNIDKIDDPELKRVLKMLKESEQARISDKYKNIIKLFNGQYRIYNKKDITVKHSIFEKYPLLNYFHDNGQHLVRDHIYLYLNTVYKENNGQA
jgi:hypothetical protein